MISLAPRRKATDGLLAGQRPVGHQVSRGLIAFALIWQGAWLAANPALWPVGQPSWVSSLFLGSVVVTLPCIALVTWGPWSSMRWGRRIMWVNIALLSAASISLLVLDVPGTVDDWVAGASLVNLAAATAGLFLPVRAAVPVILAVVAGEFLILTGRSGFGLEAPSLVSDALYAAYAIALGSAAAGSRMALERSTSRAEQARLSREAAVTDVETMQARTQRLLEQEIKVHETALNTLTAIGRGGIDAQPPMQDRLRMRAAEAGQVLRSLARANPVLADEPLRDDVADVWEGIASGIDDLRLTGVDARVSGRLPDATPRQVRAALVAATREALSNVQRHAHATNARVRITRSSQQDGSLHVRIVITDDGTGFNPALTSQGFGIDHAIQGSMLSVGGNAHLTSSAEKGTRVELEWPSPTPASQGESSFSAAAVRSVAVPVLASMWLFSALSLVSTIGRVQTPGLDLAAFIAYSMLVLIVVNQAQHGFLRWPVVLAVTVAAPFVYRLQEASLGPSLQDPWSEWSSEALVALMFVTTATGPLWAWTIVLASWLFMQGDVLTELTQPGTAVIAAGAILGLSLHRSVRDYQLNSREFVIARGSVDATRAVAQSLAARYASVAESGVLDLLERVADGAIDPSSPVVQEACRLHERHIRSLMRLDPARREFDRALIVLSDLACTRGVLIDVVVPDGLPDLGGDVLTARPGPFDLVELMERGASARITAHMDRDRISLRFVGRCPGFSKMAETEVQGGSIVMVDDDTQTFMWEVILDAPGDR